LLPRAARKDAVCSECVTELRRERSVRTRDFFTDPLAREQQNGPARRQGDMLLQVIAPSADLVSSFLPMRNRLGYLMLDSWEPIL
jgi:hypothetical protein